MSQRFVSSQGVRCSSLLDALLTTDSRQRVSLITTGFACWFMAFCILAMELVAAAGLADKQWVRWWSIASGACVLISFALIRSGVTRDWHDPAFTSVQMVYAITSNAVAYVIAGSARGITPPILTAIMMFAVFGLKPRQIRGLTFYGFFAYGAAAAAVQWWLPDDPMPGSLAAVYLLIVIMVLTMTAAMSLHANALRVRLQVQKSELSEAVAQIHEMATRDELTGLPNRRYMQDMLRLEELRARRSGNPLLVAQLDLDFFKSVNDNHGHAAGDQVLMQLGQLLPQQVRDKDLVARFGGEEFLLLLNRVQMSEAQAIIERMRAQMSAHAFEHLPERIRMTASFGIVPVHSVDELADALCRADALLYAAKRAGRDCVHSAADENPAMQSRADVALSV